MRVNPHEERSPVRMPKPSRGDRRWNTRGRKPGGVRVPKRMGGHTRESRRRCDAHEAEANATGALSARPGSVAEDRRSVERTAAGESVAEQSGHRLGSSGIARSPASVLVVSRRTCISPGSELRSRPSRPQTSPSASEIRQPVPSKSATSGPSNERFRSASSACAATSNRSASSSERTLVLRGGGGGRSSRGGSSSISPRT